MLKAIFESMLDYPLSRCDTRKINKIGQTGETRVTTLKVTSLISNLGVLYSSASVLSLVLIFKSNLY